MENSAKALYIAGSLIIALAVISLLVSAFNNMGSVQQTKDDIESEEAIIAFNREYEAFNKRIMYGVDVISCINKAMSNNEKYFEGGKYAEPGASGDEALVQVEVDLKNDSLKESLEIYYYETVNGRTKEQKYVGSSNLPEEFGDTSLRAFMSAINNVKYPKFSELIDNHENHLMNTLFNKTMEYKIAKENFKLLEESASGRIKKSFNTSDSSLYTLVKNIEYDIIITNPKGQSDYENWSHIKWITCLSDFKKRKFGCAGVEYNENNGYINKIKFEEK